MSCWAQWLSTIELSVAGLIVWLVSSRRFSISVACSLRNVSPKAFAVFGDLSRLE